MSAPDAGAGGRVRGERPPTPRRGVTSSSCRSVRRALRVDRPRRYRGAMTHTARRSTVADRPAARATAAVLLALLALPAPTARADDVVFEHVTVLDGTGADPLPDHTVVVSGDRIVRVTPSADAAPLPASLDDPVVVDGTGRVLMPGLWDLHAHPDDPEVWHLDPPAAEKERFLELFVAAGVTGVRDMGGDLELLASWKRRVAAGELVGPHLVFGGPLVDGPEPMWPGSVAVGSAEDGRAAVDDLVARGVDFVKVYSLLPRDGFLAIAERCRELGVPFAGHVPRSVTVEEAAEAGMTSQEHLLGMVRATADPDALAAALAAIPDDLEGTARRNAEIDALVDAADPERTRALAATMARLGVAHVPTLVLWHRRAWFDATAPRVASWLPLMPPTIRAWWDPAENIHLSSLSEESMAGERRLFGRYVELVAALHDAGVVLLPGTDTGGNPHLFPGASVHDELELLVDAGLSPMEAIVAATSASARLCRRPDRGVVAEGMVADLVLVDGDPLADIRATRDVRVVVAGGRLLDEAALAELLRPWDERAR